MSFYEKLDRETKVKNAGNIKYIVLQAESNKKMVFFFKKLD